MDDSDSITPPPPELLVPKPTEEPIVTVKPPPLLVSIKSIGSVGSLSAVKSQSPIIKKIGIKRPQDGTNSTIDIKLLLDQKKTINTNSSEKKFRIQNFPKDLKVTASKTQANLIVSQAKGFTTGNKIKLQFNKPVVLTKTLDKMSKEKLLSASKLSPKSFKNEGIKLVVKPQTVQISKEFDSLINDKNIKINFDKLEKISKEEFEAGNIKKKVEKLEKTSKEESKAGTSTTNEGFVKLKNSTSPKLMHPIQIINGRSTTNQKKNLIKMMPSSTKTSSENIHIRNFDNVCPVTPPKLIVNNRFIDEIKTSPRLASRSQSFDSSPGKIQKTARRLSQPVNFNDQEDLDAKLIDENKEEIESLLCSENLDNISEENKSLEDLKSISEDLSKVDRFGYRTDVDFFNQVKWINGVTYLNKSNLHFRYNELGLVDLIEEKHAQRLNLTKLEVSELVKPLHKRDGYERRSTATLVCKVCSSTGSTNEFLTKTICSIECMNLAEKQFEANKSLIKVIKPVEKNVVSDDQQPKTPYLQSSFIWDSYLTVSGGIAAPLNLFKIPYPTSENLFEIGMKLEAIDPLNASKFCVCTVVMIQGYRIKLSFDGYSVEYDFWVNADSMDIFPPGWCDRTGRRLIPPPTCKLKFNWTNYIGMTKTIAAPESNFKHLKDLNSHKNPFKIGMKLEADDLKNSGRITVATVDDVLDNRILVSFDGYSKEFCYWTDISAPYIHPVNWHEQCGFSIIAPPDINNFSWNEYLNGFTALVAPSEFFICRKTIAFEPGMKLEVVDRKLPCLIRPATVLQSMENGIKILYDGWPENYNYWLPDDSPDLHPINWCRKTNHALEYPANWQSFYKNACKIDGCRGIGHANRKHSTKHYAALDCPYEYSNWIKEVIVPSRFNNLDSSVIEPREVKVFKRRKALAPVVIKQKEPETNYPPNSDQIIEFNPILTPTSETMKSPESEPATKKQKPNPEPEKPTARETELEKRFSVSKRFLSEYGPRLIQSHELWTKNSKILRNSKNDVLDRNPLVWSVEEVVEYISYIPSCQDSCKIFRENAIDGSAFLCLTKDDIENVMKVKVGPSIKILSEINHLREEVILRFKI